MKPCAIGFISFLFIFLFSEPKAESSVIRVYKLNASTALVVKSEMEPIKSIHPGGPPPLPKGMAKLPPDVHSIWAPDSEIWTFTILLQTDGRETTLDRFHFRRWPDRNDPPIFDFYDCVELNGFIYYYYYMNDSLYVSRLSNKTIPYLNMRKTSLIENKLGMRVPQIYESQAHDVILQFEGVSTTYKEDRNGYFARAQDDDRTTDWPFYKDAEKAKITRYNNSIEAANQFHSDDVKVFQNSSQEHKDYFEKPIKLSTDVSVIWKWDRTDPVLVSSPNDGIFDPNPKGFKRLNEDIYTFNEYMRIAVYFKGRYLTINSLEFMARSSVNSNEIAVENTATSLLELYDASLDGNIISYFFCRRGQLILGHATITANSIDHFEEEGLSDEAKHLFGPYAFSENKQGRLVPSENEPGKPPRPFDWQKDSNLFTVPIDPGAVTQPQTLPISTPVKLPPQAK